MNSRQLNIVENDDGRWINIAGPSARGLMPLIFRNDEPAQPKILAGGAPQYDLRMLLQQSVFTLDGRADPLEAHPQARDFPTAFRIPREKAGELRHQLDLLGIRLSTLFPDLDALAADIRRMSGYA